MLPSIFSEELFDEFFGVPYGYVRTTDRTDNGHARPAERPASHPGTVLMRTDVQETDHSYELDVELPGFKKEDVQLQLDNGYLTIRASRHADRDQRDAQGRYIRQERFAGQCSRTFRVGTQIRKEDVSARFEDGILKISLPKQAPRELPASSNLIDIA